MTDLPKPYIEKGSELEFSGPTVAWMDWYSEEQMRAALSAPSAPSVPEGWKLVPIEPTREMMAAAVRFANGDAVYKNVTAEALKIEEDIYGEAYEAMLNAAPQPQEPTNG